ncbi:MAG: hypothetical protein K0R50_4896 [Eubacterium sp.]|jgi:hypothetical protein|nr:hypothetical protein [Eubacterium sp.]
MWTWMSDATPAKTFQELHNELFAEYNCGQGFRFSNVLDEFNGFD